jgi:alanyl aminopeptidase
LRYVYSPLFERRETRDVAYRFVVDHFDQLSKRLPSFIVGRFVWVMASFCDEAKVAEAEAFFRPRVEQIEGASKHLSQAIEAGRLCAAMASRQTPSVAARLASRSGAASRR